MAPITESTKSGLASVTLEMKARTRTMLEPRRYILKNQLTYSSSQKITQNQFGWPFTLESDRKKSKYSIFHLYLMIFSIRQFNLTKKKFKKL